MRSYLRNCVKRNESVTGRVNPEYCLGQSLIVWQSLNQTKFGSWPSVICGLLFAYILYRPLNRPDALCCKFVGCDWYLYSVNTFYVQVFPHNIKISLYSNYAMQGRAMAQAVSRRPLTAEARFGPCGICGGQSGTGTGFSPSTSVFPCQFHSTSAPLKWKKQKKPHHLHHRAAQ